MNADGSALHESRTEAKLLHVLDDYLADRDTGRAGDPAALLAAHPDIADGLRACLEVIGLADRIVTGIVDDGPPGVPLPTGLTPDPTERLESVRQALDRLSGRGGRVASPSRPNKELTSGLAGAMRAYLDTTLSDGSPVTSFECCGQDRRRGRYQLLDEVGRGGMGLVYRARDEALGRELAVKVIRSQRQSAAEQVRRFLEEAQIHGQLQHPGIVPVYDVGQLDDQRPFFAMKLVQGRTLADDLRARPMPPPTTRGCSTSSCRSARRWPMHMPKA